MRHPVEPAEWGQAGEQPGKLGVRRNHALVEDRAALGVDAGGDVRCRHLARAGPQLGGILRLRQRMQVDDAEDALIVLLQRDPVQNRAEIIAEVEVAGRLDAGKDAVHLASREDRRAC